MLNTAILILACIGQYPFYGEIPENVDTYKMTFSDGSIAYGAFALEGKWLSQPPNALAPGKIPTIVFDTPWAPRQDRPIHQPECVVETLSLRKKRLAEEWEKAGYKAVSTAHGDYYAPPEEINLVTRAADMEARLMQSAAPAAEPAQAPAPSPNALSAMNPVDRWGTDAAVLAIGLTTTFVIFRKMVMER